jgi:hypothetical protein
VQVRFETYPSNANAVEVYGVYSSGGRRPSHVLDVELWPLDDVSTLGKVFINSNGESVSVVPHSSHAHRLLRAIRIANPAGVPPPDVTPDRSWIDQLIAELTKRLES